MVELYKISSADTMYNDVMTGDNYDNFMTTWLEFINEKYSKVLTNLSYIEENGDIARWISLINQNKLLESLCIINSLADYNSHDQTKMQSNDFVMVWWLDQICNSLWKSKGQLDLLNTTWISFIDTLNIHLLCLRSETTLNFHTFKNMPFDDIKTYSGKY